MEAMTLWVSGVFILSQSRQSGAEMYQKHLSWGTGCWLLSSEVFNEVDSQGNTLTQGWLVWTPPGLPAWGTSRRLPGSSLFSLKTKETCCWGDFFFSYPRCRTVQLCSQRCIVKFSGGFKVAEFTPKIVYIDIYTLGELVQAFWTVMNQKKKRRIGNRKSNTPAGALDLGTGRSLGSAHWLHTASSASSGWVKCRILNFQNWGQNIFVRLMSFFRWW